MIKSGRLRWAGHVARMEEGRSAFKILSCNLQERDLQEDLGIDGRIILELTLKRSVSMRVIGLDLLRLGIIGEPL